MITYYCKFMSWVVFVWFCIWHHWTCKCLGSCGARAWDIVLTTKLGNLFNKLSLSTNNLVNFILTLTSFDTSDGIWWNYTVLNDYLTGPLSIKKSQGPCYAKFTQTRGKWDNDLRTVLYSIVQKGIDILYNMRYVLANIILGLSNNLQIKNSS